MELWLTVNGKQVSASSQLDPLTRAVVISLFTHRRADPDDNAVSQFIDTGSLYIYIYPGHNTVIEHPLKGFSDIRSHRVHQRVCELAPL